MMLKRIARLGEVALSAVLFRRFQSAFSSIKLRTFSASAQKAVWASAIINEILQAKPNSTFDSLHRRVKSLKLSAAVGEANEDIEKQIKLPFTEGVTIDPFFFKYQNQGFSAKRGQKMVFCPNYTVTQPMFKHLFDYQNKFLVGQQGISKTTSVILSNILSKHINIFKIQAINDQKKQEELKILQQQKILFYTPKFLYWTFPKSHQQKQNMTKQQLMDLLKEQLTELPPAILQQIERQDGMYYMGDIIRNFYWNEAGIYIKSVIDHIDTVASIIREWNEQITVPLRDAQILEREIKKWRQEEESETRWCDYQKKWQVNNRLESLIKQHQQKLAPIQRQLQYKKQEYKEKRELAASMVRLVHEFRGLGFSVIFISSVNFEHNILTYSRIMNSPLLGLEIQTSGRNEFYLQSIHYFKALKNQQGRSDFFNFFWFQIERRIKDRPAKELLPTLENRFYQIVKDIKIKHYCRPLLAVQFVQKEFQNIKESLLPLIEKQDEQKTKEYLSNLIEQYNNYYLQLSKAKIQAYAKDKETKEVVTIIYQLSKILVMRNQQEIVISLEKFWESFHFSVSNLLLSYKYNNGLIPLEYSQGQKIITFLWSSQQFVDIAKEIADPNVLHKSIMDRYNKKHFGSYHPSLEEYFDRYFEHTLVQLLQPDTFFTLAILAKKPSRKTAKNGPIFKEKSFEIFQVMKFTPFKEEKNREDDISSKKYTSKFDRNSKEDRKEDSISVNFFHILKEARSDPSKTIMGVPFYEEHTQANRNPIFDFVLIKYNRKKKLYMIETFDATVSLSGLGNKQQQAKKLLAKLRRDKEGLNFEIQHTIICSSEQCANIWDESQEDKKRRNSKYSQDEMDLVVRYSSYDQLELKYCPVTDLFAQIKFLGFRRFVQQNDKEKTRQRPQSRSISTN